MAVVSGSKSSASSKLDILKIETNSIARCRFSAIETGVRRLLAFSLLITGVVFSLYIFASFLSSFVKYGPIGMIYKVVPCNFLLEKEKEANLGEEFTLRNCETVMIRGTDVSLKITGFDPPCIKNIPCISGERVYYELEVGDTKYKNFEETPYDVITKKSDYETYAVFVIDKSESTCNKAIQYSRGADYCWSDLAERSGDQSYCNKISDLSIKDACIEKLVEKFNKNELCNEVASPKQYCKYVTLVEQNKLAECHTIMAFPWNARCYKDIAEKSGEGIQVCETLTPEKAGFCRRAITEIDF